MGKRLINVDEVEEIVPVLVDKLLENKRTKSSVQSLMITDFDVQEVINRLPSK